VRGDRFHAPLLLYFSNVRRLLLVILLLCAAGCSEPPQKEIDQAQAALDAARAAGADKYAPDEYSGADATIQKARAAVDQRDYRQALSYALDARQRALEASRLVPEARTHAKTAAEAVFKTTSDRATHLETLLHTAEEAKVPARDLNGPRKTLAAAHQSLQEARILIDAGNFTEATSALAKVRENLDLGVASIESIPPRPRPTKGKKR
jgi:hypothetical protein